MPTRYSTRDAIKVLESLGWVLRRDKVHAIMTKEGVSVPLPKDRRIVPPGTMSSILRQAGVARKAFDAEARRVL